MSGRGKPVHPPVANASLDLNGAQFSVLNSMRTGNMIIDMIIALLVPFFFKLIFSDSKQLLLRIYDFLFDRKPSEDECIREISFLSVGSSLTGRDHKNQLLQKAITLYLTEEMRLPFESRAQVSLTAFHDTSVGMGPIDKYNPLARYRLMWQPPENSWIQIEPGLEFQQRTKREGADEDEDDRGNLRPIQREMIIFELKTSKKDGPQQIDRFIERALSWCPHTCKLRFKILEPLLLMNLHEICCACIFAVHLLSLTMIAGTSKNSSRCAMTQGAWQHSGPFSSH